MEIKHGTRVYTTVSEDDPADGFAAVNLIAEKNGIGTLAARVVFWDADGQFALEMKVPELPLRVVERLISEAKETIKTA